jgi:hypothetical protein
MLSRLVRDPATFKAECEKHERRSSMSILGLDLIIDKLGDIYCIEANGQNSGTKGFIEAYGKDIARTNALKVLSSLGLPVTVYTEDRLNRDEFDKEEFGVRVIHLQQSINNISKRALESPNTSHKEHLLKVAMLTGEALELYHQKFTALIASELGISLPGNAPYVSKMPNFNQANGIIWNNTARSYIFSGQGSVNVNTPEVEWALDHKIIADHLMHPYMLRNSYLPSFDAEPMQKENYFSNILQQIPSKKIVLKPLKGSLGRGVVITEKKTFVNSKGQLKADIADVLENPEKHSKDVCFIKNWNYLRDIEDVMIQPWVQSKKYYCARTRGEHYGSIRYMALVSSNRGDINVHHLGAYARLAPEPISSKSDSLVANLHTGAHAVPLSSRDIHRIQKWGEFVLPKFYKRILRIGSNDDVDFLNYLFIDHFKEVYEEPWRFSKGIINLK